jgi:hypothetical protein
MWLVVLVLLASSCSSDGSSRTSTPDATQGPPSSTEPSTSTVAPVTETSSGVAPPTTEQTESSLDVRWEGFPLFVFPGSIHTFRFTLDPPADSVDVVTSATGTIPATFSAEVGQWLAVAAAPDTGPWTFTVEATIDGSIVASAPTAVPVVPHLDDVLVTMAPNVTVTADEPTLLSVISWGDGPTNVGIETPVEGEVQTPSGIVWVPESAELVIVDRVNQRLVVTDAAGVPDRTIPLDVEGWLTDAVVLPDGRLLAAEIRRGDGTVLTVGHLVDLDTGSVRVTDAILIPGPLGSLSLRFDEHDGIVYALFGDLYPYYDTRTDELVAVAIPTDVWHGRVTSDGQAGIQSGPDYLAATFPVAPSITEVEAAPTAAWALIGGVDPINGIQEWMTRFPFDGSPVTAVAVPYPSLGQADNVFAIRERDVVLMVKADTGLELHSVPIPN